jgi:hypothetical protein
MKDDVGSLLSYAVCALLFAHAILTHFPVIGILIVVCSLLHALGIHFSIQVNYLSMHTSHSAHRAAPSFIDYFLSRSDTGVRLSCMRYLSLLPSHISKAPRR